MPRLNWLASPRRRLAAVLVLVLVGGATPRFGPVAHAERAPDPIEALLARMSVADKVGQLMMLGFDGLSAAGAGTAVRELRAGGIVLGNGRDADETRRVIDDLQEMARKSGSLPLLTAIDQEGGPVQRIRVGVTTFSPNWEVGQIEDPTAAREAVCNRGATHGRELRRLGIGINLAPVLDIWDNPANSVIAVRAYSDDPAVVAGLGGAYIEALQREGVLATAKHFPGHGSSMGDSHQVLPVVNHDREWLLDHELVPFRAAVRAGVAAIMTDHVSYPLVDAVPNRPASLSPTIVNDLLREELGYGGLVVSDDLGAMRAIVDHYEPGDAAVQALLAGNDMLSAVGPLSSQRRMFDALMAEVGRTVSPDRLDLSVRRILRAKQRAGLLDGSAPRPRRGSLCG